MSIFANPSSNAHPAAGTPSGLAVEGGTRHTVERGHAAQERLQPPEDIDVPWKVAIAECCLYKMTSCNLSQPVSLVLLLSKDSHLEKSLIQERQKCPLFLSSVVFYQMPFMDGLLLAKPCVGCYLVLNTQGLASPHSASDSVLWLSLKSDKRQQPSREGQIQDHRTQSRGPAWAP